LIFFHQTLTEKFQTDFDFLFSIAITFAIEIVIRINQSVIQSSGLAHDFGTWRVTSSPFFSRQAISRNRPLFRDGAYPAGGTTFFRICNTGDCL
jgi:hypothetical protein